MTSAIDRAKRSEAARSTTVAGNKIEGLKYKIEALLFADKMTSAIDRAKRDGVERSTTVAGNKIEGLDFGSITKSV